MSKESSRINFKNFLADEKAQMLPIVFTVSYVITPIYLIITFLLLVVFGVLMGVDEEKYFVHGLICLGVFAVITVSLLISAPIVRKKVIDIEFERYDFDTSKVEDKEVWDLSTDEISLKFDRNGMYVNDELFYYNHLKITLATSNSYKRIGIYFQFALSEEQVVPLFVNPTTLKMIESLDIKPDGMDILEYIISDKKEAFGQIYNKGYVVIR